MQSVSGLIPMRRLSKNVYTEIYIEGCNPSFVETTDGVVMIDSPQNAIDAVRWRERMHEAGPIRYLINTEPHADHTVGNCWFTEATVVGQVGLQEVFEDYLYKVRDKDKRIADARLNDIDSVFLMEGDEFKPYGPTLTFTDEMKLELGNHTFLISHTPGHTDQQTSILVPEEGVIFPGDNIFCRCKSYIQDGDPWQWLSALDDLAKVDADIIVPGHGEPCDKTYIAKQREIIQNWIGLVEGYYDRGMTEAEAVAQGDALDARRLMDPYPVGQRTWKMEVPLNGRNIRNIYRKLHARRQAA